MQNKPPLFIYPTVALALLCTTAHRSAWGQGERTPPIAETVTFLYYQDLEAAASFYGEKLGLERTLDLDWVKMFRISPSAKVGLVNASGGTHRPSADKPVMVSFVVDELQQVDRWYERLKARGVELTSEPQDSPRSGVRAFGFRDPEGYTLEVFAWLKK
ncbi:MAG: VOC family protein [Vicinamibacteria bacterium]